MSRGDLVRTLMAYARFPSRIHGPAHWSRVRRFGALLVATVGCCWDADRLDLPRVGIVPDGRFMSTPSWRHVRDSVLAAGYEPVDEED